MISNILNDPACERALAKLDAYLDCELLEAGHLELMGHLESCPSCALEAEQRRNGRRRLSMAVRSTQVPLGLQSRIRERIHESRAPQSRYLQLAAVAATVLVSIAAGAIYRQTPENPDSYIQRVSRGVDPLLRVGLGDHLHCAVLRRKITPVAAGGRVELPERYRGLVTIAQAHVPSGLTLVAAHECRYQSRPFVHLTFSDSKRLLSLVIARRTDGESLGRELHSANAAAFQVAAFETGDYFVYSVSDLSEAENRGILTALNAPLAAFFHQTGA